MQVKIFRREFYFKINQLNSQHAQLFKASVLDQKKKKKKGSTNGQKQEIKTLKNKFFFFSKDRKRKLIKEGQIFDNEIKKGGRKKLIIKMSRSNHIWGWL